jgi:hypothetical protein
MILEAASLVWTERLPVLSAAMIYSVVVVGAIFWCCLSTFLRSFAPASTVVVGAVAVEIVPAAFELTL